jgi:ABC-type Zn2+ transport system substrate-binding protein/surface adhesin
VFVCTAEEKVGTITAASADDDEDDDDDDEEEDDDDDDDEDAEYDDDDNEIEADELLDVFVPPAPLIIVQVSGLNGCW